MLPFFAVGLILSAEGARLLYKNIAERSKYFKYSFVALVLLLSSVDVLKNVQISLASFDDLENQKTDIAFEISGWLLAHYGKDVKILVDHPTKAYLSSEFKKVKFLKYSGDELPNKIKKGISEFKPSLIYYNTGLEKGDNKVFIDEIIHDRSFDIRLVKLFSQESKVFKRFPDATYAIYQVDYLKDK